MQDINDTRHVLVLGAYGLIGAAVVRTLVQAGHQVTGLGRDAETAARVHPDLDWVIRDLRDVQTAEDWGLLLGGVDVVVNCAGALQDGGADDLAAVQAQSVAGLAEACGPTLTALVQISAVGVGPDASTAFFRTKAEGDAAVRAAKCDWWILRPGLVIGDTGYGGSLLLRMLAAVPGVQPVALGDVPVQTVALSDVAEAVWLVVEGALPPRTECDLVEEEARTLRDVVDLKREWLGFTPARRVVDLPEALLPTVGWCADQLGRLGWRPPVRSTALDVLADGVTGSPAKWRALGRADCASLEAMLAAMPARAEDRLAARMALLMPFVLGGLFLFWMLSGLIGLLRAPTAAGVLVAVGWPFGLAVVSVVFWAVVDIAIAVALAQRRWATQACDAMVAVCLIYLASATLFVPGLWIDPLGPLVKVIPAILLALVLRVMLVAR